MTECKHEHQSPSGEYNHIDYSEKMPDKIFRYNQDFYPLDETLPDPQINPIIPGAHVPLDKVGIAPVDLPILSKRRDGESPQVLQAQASLYCKLDDPNAKGLNLSRLYLLMHEAIKDHLSVDGISNALQKMATKVGSSEAYCKLRYKYPWTQKALRTRQPLTQDEINAGEFETLENGESISLKKMEGHIAYDTTLEGRYFDTPTGPVFRFWLTIEYVYSSTCPCSFELADNAEQLRNAAANAHSQRSRMQTTIEFGLDDIVWIEDLVELHRQLIPTEVQVVVKRRDEQAFAELNGSNLLFSEDAVRLMYGGLNKWFEEGRIHDFRIVTNHEESLHPWNAIALTSKGIEGGLR